jgi:nitrite reductase/ring-hydroxylating ferredoxin subunit
VTAQDEAPPRAAESAAPPPTSNGSAPPAGDYVVVADRDEVTPGTLKRVAYGDKPVVLANVAGRLYALADTCLHRGASLAEGRVRGSMLVCPWHAWTYDPATGRVLFPRGDALAHLRRADRRRHGGDCTAPGEWRTAA